MTIVCFYTCEACHLLKVGVEVPAREEEAVTDWMDRTVRLIGADHFRRSPECRVKTLTNLMIPMTGAAKIGGPSVQ